MDAEEDLECEHFFKRHDIYMREDPHMNYVCQKCGLLGSKQDVLLHNVAVQIVSEPSMGAELKARQIHPSRYRAALVRHALQILHRVPGAREGTDSDPFHIVYITAAAIHEAAQELATLWNLKPLVTAEFLTRIAGFRVYSNVHEYLNTLKE